MYSHLFKLLILRVVLVLVVVSTCTACQPTPRLSQCQFRSRYRMHYPYSTLSMAVRHFVSHRAYSEASFSGR